MSDVDTPLMPVYRHYQEGMTCWRDGNYQNAIAHLARVGRSEGLISLLAGFYRGLASYALGLRALGDGQYAEAARHLRLAVHSNPGALSLPYLLSACAVAGADMVQGEPFTAEWLLPENRRVLAPGVSRALTMWRDGESQRAIAALRDQLLEDPDNAQIYYHLGLMLSSANEYDEAITCFRTAARLQPQNADIFSALGLTYTACKRFDQALAAFQRAHQVRPGDARISLSLTMAAQCLDGLGHKVELRLRPALAGVALIHDADMVESLGKLLAQEPDLTEAFLDLPESPMDPELFSLLLNALRRGISGRETFADLQLLLARVLERLNDRDQAIEAAKRAVAANPRYTNALIFLARQYAHQGLPRQAVDVLEEALAGGARYADVYFMLGEQLEAIGNVRQAAEAYRLALQINKDYRAARQALARIAA